MFALFPSRTIAVTLFGFSVHWYGLLYLFAFLIAAWLLPRLQKYRGLLRTNDEWLSVLSAAIVGVILGGRLGFVFFYEPEYFLHNPTKILAVWEGGMSSHGGFIGVSLALWYITVVKKVPKRALADIITIPTAIGLALGRLGNFVNQELYGTPTHLPWALTIPGVLEPRHPLPIYDSLLSLCIAAVCYLHIRNPKSIPGRTVGIFLILYGLMRFALEFIREQQYPLFFLLTRGQLLTLPILLAGILCMFFFRASPVAPRKDS